MSTTTYTQIGPYRIESQLGRGGMGVVLKGIDATLEREVAIKLMSASLANEREVVQRFLREARAMARISDTHVVQVYGVDTFEGRPYIAMEFIQGSDLHQLLVRKGRQSPASAVALVLAAARGLHAAHEVGLIHRDIKPANLLLNQKGVLKVTDFGIALAHSESAPRLTGTGLIVGTPGYLAPEVCVGQPADARSDIYALGVVLFELLAGIPPFPGDTPLSRMMQTVEQPAPDIRTLNPEVDAELAGIVDTLLAKVPQARLQSCAELIQSLSHWQLARAPLPIRTDARPAVPPATITSTPQTGSGVAQPFSQPAAPVVSKTKLGWLAPARRPLWLLCAVALVFALDAGMQLWLMRLLYDSLERVSNGYYSEALTALKFRVLVTAGFGVIAYVAFALWFLRTYEYVAQIRGMPWPKNPKLALALWSIPPFSLYFSWRLWRQLTNAVQAPAGPDGVAVPRNATTLGLWWLSFFGSLALSASAWYLLPMPLQPSQTNTYVLTLELFARGLWLFAGLLVLMLMLRISLGALRLTP